MDNSDQPISICHIKSIHMYQLHSTDTTTLPFGLITGEAVVHSGMSIDGLIVITNYRLYLQSRENHFHIPLGLIEIVELKELFYLHIGCKDARTYRCTFENNEKCVTWYDRISKAAEPPRQLEQLFAFYHCIWSEEKGGEEVAVRLKNQRKYTFDQTLFENEMTRLQFQGHSWKISRINENYKFCPTYPPYLLVPSCINDEMLESVAKFRGSRRIPAVVWRHTRNGAVIVRSSQPEVGWLGWRSGEDEDLIKAISYACSFDRNVKNCDKESNLSHSPGSYQSDESLQITGEIRAQEKKVLIMDARSYTTAVANRARGGGCECPEYYPNCEIQFMNLANIHSIRKSFHALRQLCTSAADQANWYSLLEGTRWLSHMSGLIKAAITLVTAVERDARPVLVHCSDGWDRTPQIVALAELMLDPYYRTIDGFRILIEREWLAFGHKFADRCGHSTGSDDQNERCPVFLQWLDCVHQLLIQFPCAFEFSQIYLVKMVQHIYSNLFGTFLCNTQRERSKTVYGRTFSIWDFLCSPCFKNHLYATVDSPCGRRVLWPQCNVRDLHLWSEVYLGSIEAAFITEIDSGFFPCPRGDSSPHYMPKTRSYGDIMNEEDISVNHYRRSSDPSINCESKMALLSSEKSFKQNGTSKEILNDRNLNNLDSHQENCFQIDLDDGDCNQDCIFKNRKISSQDTELELNGFDRPSSDEKLNDNMADCVIRSETEKNSSDIKVPEETKVANNATLTVEKINNNYDIAWEEKKQSSTKESKTRLDSENAPIPEVGDYLDVETSTDTIVSNNIICGDQETRYYNSQHSSSNDGWDNTMKQQKDIYSCQYPLGEDGLITLRCDVQERLNQIKEEHNRDIDLLERELHIARQNLIRQSRHKCNNTDCERQDDNSSVIDSVCSTSETQASAGESLRSDMSWVAVEETSVNSCQSTLWVPDHAVNKCTGCSTEFWLGRRRHHCRKCGKIFCADCSEKSTPLPSEQLYNPVRVCTNCYSELQQDYGDFPNHCKHTVNQTTNANPQIAASSN